MLSIEFIPVQLFEIIQIQKAATDIWNAYYLGIISQDQIDYMLRMMYEPGVIEKEIQSGVCWEFIEYNNKRIGFLSYYFEAAKRKIKLSKLYIYPQYHGKGLGQTTLNYVISEARKMKAARVYLTVNKKNIHAINVYMKVGFIKSKSVVMDIGNGYVMDDYIMQYSI
jgi:ribosomal protein S18 acetylase RimI-like enzyme